MRIIIVEMLKLDFVFYSCPTVLELRGAPQRLSNKNL